MVGDAFALPPTFIGDITANASDMIDSVWPIIALIGGVVLALGVASWLIETFRDMAERRDRITPEGVQKQIDEGII